MKALKQSWSKFVAAIKESVPVKALREHLDQWRNKCQGSGARA